MAQGHILVVDDEPDIRLLIQEILEDEGYQVSTAENAEAARACFASKQPDLVLLDIWMPDVDGITLLREWQQSDRLQCPVVMISGHGTLETAVEATRLGAHDFIQKPLSLAKLLATVKQSLGSQRAPSNKASVRQEHHHEPQGSSPPMQLLRQKAEQAARHASPLLIFGEPGTGKEALAAYVHHLANASGPLIVADAARLSDPNSGHYLLGEQQAEGLFARAAGGSLYLGDIANIKGDAQQLISSVLTAGQFAAMGSDVSSPLQCRIMAGISQRSEQLLAQKRVLKQLFLQLNVLALQLPALRERPEDVPELVSFYTDWYSNHEGLAYRHFSISGLNRLRNHDWTGNEKELKNLIQRLLILGGEGEVSAQEVEEALRQGSPPSLPAGSATPGAFELPLREAREQFEREYLTYQLRKAGGSVGKLSTAVGMERTHLYRKLRSLGIDPKAIGTGDTA